MGSRGKARGLMAVVGKVARVREEPKGAAADGGEADGEGDAGEGGAAEEGFHADRGKEFNKKTS